MGKHDLSAEPIERLVENRNQTPFFEDSTSRRLHTNEKAGLVKDLAESVQIARREANSPGRSRPSATANQSHRAASALASPS